MPESEQELEKLARKLCQHGKDRHNILAAQQRKCSECERHLYVLRESRLAGVLKAGQELGGHVGTLTYDDVNEPHNCKECQDGSHAIAAALARFREWVGK
jgi:hypothetical protein